jgi:hypothetical protein
LGRTLVRSAPGSEKIGDSDSGNNADNRHNDEQLDKREALLILVHHVFHLLLEEISWFFLPSRHRLCLVDLTAARDLSRLSLTSPVPRRSFKEEVEQWVETLRLSPIEPSAFEQGSVTER